MRVIRKPPQKRQSNLPNQAPFKRIGPELPSPEPSHVLAVDDGNGNPKQLEGLQVVES